MALEACDDNVITKKNNIYFRHINCDYKSRVKSVITDRYLDVITAWEACDDSVITLENKVCALPSFRGQ